MPADGGARSGATYLPTSVRGVWLYVHLVIDVSSRKVLAWDMADREDAKNTSDPPCRQRHGQAGHHAAESA